jgi:hypothetical protein
MAKVASIELSDFYGSVHEFYLALLLRKLFRRILPAVISFFENSSIVKQFCQLFGGISSARRMYSSLKVNIADGSIPIKSNFRNNGSKNSYVCIGSFCFFKKTLDI